MQPTDLSYITPITNIFRNDIIVKSMNYLVIFLACLLGICSAASIPKRDLEAVIKNVKPDVKRDFVEKFLREIEHPDERAGGITAIVNEFADKICENLHDVIILNGLDPVELPDLSVKLIPVGVVNMTKGWLQDTSTISRYHDVVVSYSVSTRLLQMEIPIKFDALQFTYNYVVKVLLLGVDGAVDGKVSNLKINLKLDFDFKTYQVALSKFDITDSGLFTIHFTGNGLVDWLINAMSAVVSVVLHPIIVRIIQLFVQGPVNSIVDMVNQILNSILHPESVAAFF